MRALLRKGMESTLDIEATRIPQQQKNKGLACRISRNKHMIDPISYHVSVGKIKLELLEFPPIKLPKLSGYAIWCWGYRGSNISHPN